MNILLAAAEVSPFAKTGGLSDVTSSLPKEWKKLGHNPIIVLPKYGFINVEKYGFQATQLTLNVSLGHRIEFAQLWKGYLPNTDVPVYLIEHEEYFNRPGIYGEYSEYYDNDQRFLFLSKAVFEVCKAINFQPDIIHAHDYHTAFTMPFLKISYANDPFFANTAGVYTIHNLAYQGKFNPYKVMDISGFGMKEFYHGSWFEHEGVSNFMKVGIMFADKITTVSPTYSFEIRKAYFAEGLQDALNSRSADLIGVLNGVYYDEWNPEIDELITQKFDVTSIASKEYNKVSLLKDFMINDSDNLNLPLFGMVTRLTEQKGIDIIKDKLEYLISSQKIRFIILGSGDSRYVDFFNYLSWKYPKNAITYIGYDNALSHKIMAASDFLLVPSRFEPCGLTQMYALKYGTVPIVRATGGLTDTIFEYNPENKTGNGFVFNNYSPDDFEFAMNRAISYYKDEPNWTQIKTNAMHCDYSSYTSAKKYIEIFNWAIEKKLNGF